MLVSCRLSGRVVERLRRADPLVEVELAPPALQRFLAADLPPGINSWLGGGDAANAPDGVPLEGQIEQLLQPAEVLIAPPSLYPLALDRAPNVRWVQFLSAGIDRFPVGAGREVLFTNGSGAGSPALAEHVLGLMLLFARNLPAFLQAQGEQRWQSGVPTRELGGATCGIVGLGSVGREVARRAQALGMRVIAIKRSAPEPGAVQPADEILAVNEMDTLLNRSDYVVLAAPLTPATRHLIGAQQLAVMRRSAILINVGRGALVDEPALMQALHAGAIAGAALDVVEQEPLPAGSPLWSTPNLVLTSHSSVFTAAHLERLAGLIEANLQRYLRGQPLLNLVDSERGY